MAAEKNASITNPPPRPLLVWDGDCSFCRRWITRWQYLTGDAIDYEPYQRAAERFGQIPKEDFGKAVHLIEPDGTVRRAAAAVFRSLALGGHARWLWWLYRHFPPFAWVAELLYGFVARHRDLVDRIDKIVVGTETRPATYVLTRAVFLRALGVVYLIAFLSLFVQIDGLVGSAGILPASAFVDAATRVAGDSRWWQFPTLAYISSSDAFLHGLCIVGIVCSCALIVGALPLLMTIVLWACYLSLVTVGQTFLNFQWDALLLETGLLAILWSPLLWVKLRTPPSGIVLFLLRFLLFRLMLLSAIVKWFSGDPAWQNMTALRWHFETQPLPTWTSWYTHWSPHWVLAVGCFLMFVTEFLVPFLYFAPRRTRMLAFWLTVLLQVSILATGNYGFFNLLTITLALTLLDDAAISRTLGMKLPDPSLLKPPPRWRRWVLAPVALVLIVVTTMEAIQRSTMKAYDWPPPLAWLEEHVTPFRSTNAYGLFAVMTKDRPEIVIEASDDGQTWKPYVFRYKMGDVTRRPKFVVGHMPRLDWQMWFAALSDSPPRWFEHFLLALIQGKPDVLKLLESNPFPDHRPRFVRAALYDYRFSDAKTRSATGAWWTAKPVRVFFGPVELRKEEPAPDFRL